MLRLREFLFRTVKKTELSLCFKSRLLVVLVVRVEWYVDVDTNLFRQSVNLNTKVRLYKPILSLKRNCFNARRNDIRTNKEVFFSMYFWYFIKGYHHDIMYLFVSTSL